MNLRFCDFLFFDHWDSARDRTPKSPWVHPLRASRRCLQPLGTAVGGSHRSSSQAPSHVAASSHGRLVVKFLTRMVQASCFFLDLFQQLGRARKPRPPLQARWQNRQNLKNKTWQSSRFVCWGYNKTGFNGYVLLEQP